MIFVTVGSQKFQFDRLLKTLDSLVADGTIQDEVFAQSGACTYMPTNFRSKPYLNRDEFQHIMADADIVITHGGTGAIVGALKAGKKVIAVPRLAKYGEHVDDHQLQLVFAFTKGNLICSCEDLDKLSDCIKEAESNVFATYRSNTDRYLENLCRFIEHNN